uniref:Uncharacterized protein n=1 Tax=Tanacetum cinerariifolium TaxID=118510 RepID=A0A6L2JRZ0_TANCI|nr:hypothetical protein [Tanacetum cinerariifolium]
MDEIDQKNKEGTAETFNAFTNMPAQSDPLGHLHEELRTLNTKIDQLESNISKKDSIKQSVLKSFKEKLPFFDAQVQQTLQDQLPSILFKPTNKQFNAFNTLESHRRVTLQQELSKVIKTKQGVSVRNKDLRLVFKDKQHKSFKKLMLRGRKVNTSEKKVTDDEPLVKKLKFLIPTSSSIPSPTPFNSIMHELLQKPDATAMTIE